MTALKAGKSLRDATQLALEDLDRLKSGFLGGVVIHAIDSNDNHLVANFRCEETIRYWVWTPDMQHAVLCEADLIYA